jgi:hypothetical protein
MSQQAAGGAGIDRHDQEILGCPKMRRERNDVR